MPKFAANLSTLFTEFPLPERFAAAAKTGFKGVEVQFPYGMAKEEVAERLRANGQTLVLFNLPPGNFEAGERGIACLPGRIQEFQDGVGIAIEYARAAGCKTLNCLAGIVPQSVSRDAARRTFVENLKFAASKLKEEGILLVTEAINSYDVPGFFLNWSTQAMALFDDAGADNLKLQYDIYHMQRMEGELASTIARLLPRIGHIQLADNPGRHEPGTGEINFPWLLAFIDRIGYAGWIGCEYMPLAGTAAGLGWLDKIA
jgi:hydroxypyruvate isomerase